MPDPARPSDPDDLRGRLDVCRTTARRLAERLDLAEQRARQTSAELRLLRSWLEVEHDQVDGSVLVDWHEWGRIVRLIDFVLDGLPDPSDPNPAEAVADHAA